jgi:hypothetical protein
LTTSPVGSEMRTMGEGGPSEEGLGLGGELGELGEGGHRRMHEGEAS